MKALTIWQPWAWAIAEEFKPIENRSWRPSGLMLGKRIAIHTGKKCDDRKSFEFVREQCVAPVPAAGQLVYGAVIATAVLDSFVTDSENPWFFGPWGWVLRDVQKVKPVFVRGFQCLWEFDERLLVPA